MTRSKLVMFDELRTITRKEEMIVEHELTPDGVYLAVIDTTGDKDLAQRCRSAAQAAEERKRGR